MRTLLFLCAAFAVSACGAPTPSPAPAVTVEIRDAWASPTPGGVDVSGGFLTIANLSDQDDTLLAASSPRAARVEIHEMTMDGAVMRMRQTPSLAIPAGEEVALAPGGLHLMFFGVTQPFAEGEEVPVTLTFEHAGDISAALAVRRSAGGGAQSHDMR